MQYKFQRSLVGGTFDRFHLGHQKLLVSAFEDSENVIIGIATDELFKDKDFVHLIENYSTREQSVLQFLTENDFEDRWDIVPIHDFFGTSLTDEDLDAIFITESNKENVLKINEERKKKKFKPLEIIIVPYVLGNDNEIISSERIRKGEIDRKGNSYIKLFMEKQQFILPEHEREALREPIGSIETDMNDVIELLTPGTFVIAVGDIVAQTLSQLGRSAAVSIIDGRTRREILTQDINKLFSKARRKETQNPAGTITQKGALSIQEAITDFEKTNAEQLIVISGEEDLLAIPSVLLSPLQAVVLYGQFDKGIVVVKVSEQNKKRVYNLFRKFQ